MTMPSERVPSATDSTPATLPPPAAKLIVALVTAMKSPDPSDDEVRSAIRECTRALKDAGVPPERALVVVKEAANDALRARLEVDEKGIFRDRVVRWCIHEYYAAD